MGVIKRIVSKANKGLDKVSDAVLPHGWIKYDSEGLPSGFTGVGKTVLWGATGVASAAAAFDQRNQNNLGTMAGMVTATPTYDSYLKGGGAPGGADGSLVFALDRTKNGGYL